MAPSLPSQNPDESVPALRQLILQQIWANPAQRISFAEYMHLALYHPQYGYYSTGAGIGAKGDFVTAPYLGADFGELLAEQFVEMWHHLGQPTPFSLVEMGAGHGLLVQDVVDYVRRMYPDCFAALTYSIVELSPALKALQQQRLSAWQDWSGLRWVTWDQIPSHSLVGCCFSNELVDALPVHQVVVQSGQLREIYISVNDAGDLVETIGDLSSPQLDGYFQQVGIDLRSPHYPDGYRTEVNLAMLDWLTTVAQRLQRGYVLTIDYGYPATRYYNPQRSQGTLQCYYRHAHHSDPLIHIGRQDITAHVDFTALQRQGDRLGLQTLGYTAQGLFLMSLGLGDRIAALSSPDPGRSLQSILQRREALHGLVDPMGFGNFGVLIQSKGLEGAPALKGLTEPQGPNLTFI